MSEEKLRGLLQQVADGELDVDEALDEISSRGQIDFSEPYEGE